MYGQVAISVQKFPEFHIRIFPGFSGSGFFPEKKVADTCRWSNSSPFCGKYKSISYFIEFGYLAEAGRYEKCKKHTFLGKKQIFVGQIII